MSGSNTVLTATMVCLFLACSNGCAQTQRFPQWRVGQRVLSAVFVQSPIIVAGELLDIDSAGVQKHVAGFGDSDRSAEELFWCRGKLKISYVLRGAQNLLHEVRPYMWASINPGCQIDNLNDEGKGPKLQLWFVREEGEGLLRPLFDSGSTTHLTLMAKSHEELAILGKESIGRYLLSPDSYKNGVDDIAADVYELALISCSLLPEIECRRELCLLSRRHPSIKEQVRLFLEHEHGYVCHE